MIIDLILDRKEGVEYSAKGFYNDVMMYGDIGHGITYAMDYGAEKDVKNALKQYLIDNDYNLEIGLYIDSVEWLSNGDILVRDILRLEKMRNKEIAQDHIEAKVKEIFGEIDIEKIVKNAIAEHLKGGN